MKLVTAEVLVRRDLTAVMAEDSVEDALHVLHSHSLSGVPVIDDTWHLLGFFSEIDVLRSVMSSYLEILTKDFFLFREDTALLSKFSIVRKNPVRQYMQKNCIFVTPESNIMYVADLILRCNIKRLPVVENSLLVGIIDQSDLSDYLMNQEVKA